jgi:hypothetical protein
MSAELVRLDIEELLNKELTRDQQLKLLQEIGFLANDLIAVVYEITELVNKVTKHAA